jgi:hypothetical protein
MRKITVRILVNERYLIAIQQAIRRVIRMNGLDLASFIDDAVILDLQILRRLEINPARISAFRAPKNSA